MPIVFLGTGLMGSGFVQALRARNEPARVWNRTVDRARALEGDGAVVCSDVRDAVAGAERVHLSLSDDAAVDEVLARALESLTAGAVVIDHTTTSPHGTAARAERLRARGVAFLHAPVFMGPSNARNGTGLMLVSGPEAIYRRAEGALKSMTGEVWYLGERTDHAAAVKLFGNAMIITITSGLADVFAMARAVGIAPGDAMELFGRFKPGNVVEGRGPRMARGDFTASFELTMARKDVRLMLETAARGSAPLSVLPAIAQRMDALLAQGHGDQDLGVLAVDAVR